MTVRREANNYIPIPEIRYLEQKKSSAKRFFIKKKSQPLTHYRNLNGPLLILF